MFIWRGLGIVVPAIILTCLVLVNLVTDYLLKLKGLFRHNLSYPGIACILAAIGLHFFDRYLHKQKRSGAANNFLFVPVSGWVLIMAGCGLALYIVQLVRK